MSNTKEETIERLLEGKLITYIEVKFVEENNYKRYDLLLPKETVLKVKRIDVRTFNSFSTLAALTDFIERLPTFNIKYHGTVKGTSSCYGHLLIRETEEGYFWSMPNYTGDDWKTISKSLYEELKIISEESIQ